MSGTTLDDDTEAAIGWLVVLNSGAVTAADRAGFEAWLAARPDEERPGRVIFVVGTDGQENASRDFTRERVNRLVEAKKKLGWDFVFLSADLGAFEDAGHIGVDYKSRLMFDKSKGGNDRAWEATSRKIRERRMGAADVAFDEDDRRTAGRG